jgi:hypothetical protein
MIRTPRPANPAAHLVGGSIFLAAAIVFLLDGSIWLDLEPLRGAAHLIFGSAAVGAAFVSLRELYRAPGPQ